MILPAPGMGSLRPRRDVFTDPLVECLSCHKRYRADHLEEEYEEKKGRDGRERRSKDIACPNCGTRGAVDRAAANSPACSRPTSAPSPATSRPALPAPGDRAGHLRELRQRAHHVPQEAAVRHRPDRQDASATRSRRATSSSAPASSSRWRWSSSSSRATDEEWHQYWIDDRWHWYTDLGINADNLRLFEHPQEKLAHYSKGTIDIEYRFGFQGSEWGELEGIANRTDFDLSTPRRGLRHGPERTSTRPPTSATPRT